MKVILIKDIENLGKKYEVKEVADGFAKNYLFPKKLAKPATEENLKWLEKKLKEIEMKAEEDLKKYQKLASSLDGFELFFEAKVKEGTDELYEKITPPKIAEKLKEKGFQVSKNNIELSSPIKKVGEYEIKIKLPHNLEAFVRLIVSPQE